MKSHENLAFAALAAIGFTLATLSAFGQTPVISSFGANGQLICTNLQPGSTASVEWASAAAGPWTNNWVGLDTVAVASNGMIQVSVPMFYRVRGVPAAPAGMELIPAGSFTMGDTFGEGRAEELPLHTVYVSAFYMDRYVVTKALWDDVYSWATNHGYSFRYSDSGQGKAANHPVHTVTWFDTVKWCNARSEKEGRVPAYYTSAEQTAVYRNWQVNVQNVWVKWTTGYRLPTEAEWEKAARGGATGLRFPWTDAETITHSRANYSSYPASGDAYDISPTQGYHPAFNDGVFPYTSPVGYFAPNGYGLYDMAGNVWEWCWDWDGAYSGGSQTDPRGPTSSSFRVARGGCWSDPARVSRTAYRGIGWPSNRGNLVGFHSVLPPGQ